MLPLFGQAFRDKLLRGTLYVSFAMFLHVSSKVKLLRDCDIEG
jgi:hypothetical protein